MDKLLSKLKSLFSRPVVKVRLDSDARLPLRATPGSAGIDLYCVGFVYNKKTGQYVCRTGVSVEIPNGYFGLLCPRSSIAAKGVRVANCVGVIDSDYRGEITMVFDHSRIGDHYGRGERIGQLIVVPCPDFEIVQTDSLTTTLRGEGGYGSTGK